MSTSRTTERRYEVGTLVIGMYDTEGERMIFMSSGSQTLSSRSLSPEQAQAQMNDVVAEILSDFPPEG